MPMNFEKAIEMARAGHDIRHPGMGKGWVARRLLKDKSETLFFINPITRSNYEASFTKEDKARTDWIAGEGLAAL